jgi:hypothetical protein
MPELMNEETREKLVEVLSVLYRPGKRTMASGSLVSPVDRSLRRSYRRSR